MTSLSSTLKSWVPTNSPRAWLVINAICCLWSFLLVLIVLFTDDSIGKRLAKAQYLVYDLFTTLVWVVETGLTSVFDYDVTSVEQWVEFALAIYFLGDSTVTVIKWKLQKEHTSLMGIAVFIGFVAYLYRCIADVRDLRRRQDFEELRDVDSQGFLPVQDAETSVEKTVV